MSLAGFIITVGLVLRVLLVDAVVGQVHELVAQSLHGRRIPEQERHKIIRNLTTCLTSAFAYLLHKLKSSSYNRNNLRKYFFGVGVSGN